MLKTKCVPIWRREKEPVYFDLLCFSVVVVVVVVVFIYFNLSISFDKLLKPKLLVKLFCAEI